MGAALIVLSGPPLPGRWALARALARRLGARRFPARDTAPPHEKVAGELAAGRIVIVDGELAGAGERVGLFAPPREERILVQWPCSRRAARAGNFHPRPPPPR